MNYSLELEIAEHNLKTTEMNKQYINTCKPSDNYSYFTNVERLNNNIKNFNASKEKPKSEMFIYRIGED